MKNGVEEHTEVNGLKIIQINLLVWVTYITQNIVHFLHQNHTNLGHSTRKDLHGIHLHLDQVVQNHIRGMKKPKHGMKFPDISNTTSHDPRLIENKY